MGSITFRGMSPATPEQIAEEAGRLRRLRRLVDLTEAMLYQADLTPEDCVRLIAQCRSAALELFPGREETFDLLCRPRLIRVLKERFDRCGAGQCVVHR